MRTFRFTTGKTAAAAQEQRIACDLHLEPTSDIVQEQANDCSCYTEETCRGKLGSLLLNVLNHQIFIFF